MSKAGLLLPFLKLVPELVRLGREVIAKASGDPAEARQTLKSMRAPMQSAREKRDAEAKQRFSGDDTQ